MADLRLKNVDKKFFLKKEISWIVLETDYVIEDQEKGGKVGLTKRAAEFFCTICYKRFPHSLKILSLGPLACFTKGTEVFTFFVSKDLLLIKVFCLPWAWKE